MNHEVRKYRILQINPHFSRFTSTGKQIIGLADCYARDFDSFVAFSEKAGCQQGGFYYGCYLDKRLSAGMTRLFGNRYGWGNISTSKLIRIIQKIHPDLVHIHCINNYDVNILRLFKYLKRHDIPAIVTEHAEFFHTGNCSHAFECTQYKDGCRRCPRKRFATKSYLFGGAKRGWQRMKKAFSDYPSCAVVSVSPWLADRAGKSGILAPRQIGCIYNGIDTSVFHYFGMNRKKQLLYVTSNAVTSNKGLDYLLSLAKLLPEYHFIVVGHVDAESVNPKGVPNIEFLGTIKDQNRLSELYQSSFVTLTLSKVETFGMTVAESLCCGTPVVGFASGGPESIALPEYSRFYPHGDLAGVAGGVHDLEAQNLDPHSVSNKARDFYSFEVVGEKYKQLVLSLLQK